MLSLILRRARDCLISPRIVIASEVPRLSLRAPGIENIGGEAIHLIHNELRLLRRSAPRNDKLIPNELGLLRRAVYPEPRRRIPLNGKLNYFMLPVITNE